MTEIRPSSKPTQPTQLARLFSIRWRLMLPLFAAVLLIVMIGAYALANNLGNEVEVSQRGILLQSSRAVTDRAAQLYDRHRTEAQRTAFTIGVAEAVRDGNTQALQPILESLISAGDLDALIVADREGNEVIGVQRVAAQGGPERVVSTGTGMMQSPVVQAVLFENVVGATGLLLTPQGVMLFTAVPIDLGGEPIGVSLVGARLDRVLADLQGSALVDLALYGPDGDLLQTTYPETETRGPLNLPPEVFDQALTTVDQLPERRFEIEATIYQAIYQPLTFGPQTLGVIGTLIPDNAPFVTETGRQITAIFAAALAGGVVTVAFIAAGIIAGRAERVTQVAEKLAAGETAARTRMKAVDEITAIGQALDRFADAAQEQQDALRQALRRQRREAAHLVAVLESIPDGVIVQDTEGRVVVMNDQARSLLGSQRVFRSSGLHELTALVQQVMGTSLAPGLYALGDPQRVNLDDRMLSAQAAAVLTQTQHRIGTVILLRDITDHVRQERAREEMLNRLAEDIQVPLASLGRTGAGVQSDLARSFAREVTRQAVALQKMILDMRELANVDALSVRRAQRILRLETLVWAVANEWRQVAQVSGLQMVLQFDRKGLFVLGDEKRLRWAIGNLIDNAIKYTLPGGALSLEIKEESEGMATLRVRDNGVGISPDDRPNVFTQFYRGTPIRPDGSAIRVPGMGQGLYIARQIIEAHGGKIQLKSTVGVGTAVYFGLPLTAPIGIEIPPLPENMEGETVQLPAGFASEWDSVNRR